MGQSTWGVRVRHLTQQGIQIHPVLQIKVETAEQKEIWKAAAMADHFEKIQKLADPVPGCPNFRRLPGYKVYCCGQPTKAGFEAVLEKVTGSVYPKDGKIIWINLRQEPIVYVNGEPICARPPNKIGEYAKLGNVTRDSIKEDEVEFEKIAALKSEVETLIEKNTITLDLYEILGQCTWGQMKA